MTKDLKQSYEYLNLPYSATIEDVEARKNALIKIANAKSIEKKIDTKDEIQKIEDSANIICLNLNQNGIPNEKSGFNTSKESLGVLMLVLVFSIILCVSSFFAFL